MNYTFYSISIAGAIVAGFCAFYVLVRNPDSRLNQLFFFFATAVAFYDLTDAGMCIAVNRATAELFLRLTVFFWLLYLPLFLHFCIRLSGLLETTQGKVMVYLGYISAMIMVYPSALTNWIYDSVRESAFGYHAGIGKFFLVLGIYSLIIVIQQAVVLRYTWKVSKEKRQKDMSFILFAALLAAGAVGTFFDVILPFLGYYVHSFIPAWISIFVLIFAYVMARFGSLLVAPAQLANDILATMPDMMVFIDHNKYINLVNKNVMEELGYAKEELINKHIKELFSKDMDCDAIYGNIKQKRSIRDEKPSLRKKNGELIPVLMDATMSRDRFGEELGCVIIFRNMSETERLFAIQKQTSEQLAAQVAELERLNRITMQREDRMIELKKKIKELEEKLGGK